MEFQEVVRRRRMVRRYSAEPVAPEIVQRLLANALRAPSAGFSQGWAFLVLEEPSEVTRFWRVTTPATELPAPLCTTDVRGEDAQWLRGMRTAPVVIVPLSSKAAYLLRYAEPDKGWTDRDETRWPVPYWHVDTGMAALLILQTAVDEGLGACFFGIPPAQVDPFREEFGVPEEYFPVGAITLGHRTDEPGVAGSAARRPRKSVEDVVHRGSW